MTPLPKAYAWIDQVAQLPKLVAEARKLYGVHETAGGANSPVIMGWAAEVGLRAVYTADSIPWCGLFMAVVAKRAGKNVVNDPLWALNWGKFGVDGGQPELGDILTFVRKTATGTAGHVGLYVGEDASAYHVLGGNTADAVSIARIAKDRLRACRQPPYSVKPAGAKPHILAASGALSRNEA